MYNRPMASPKRKSVNLTISPEVIEKARSLKLNLSEVAEKGMLSEIKKHLEQQWKEAHKKQIDSYNKRIQEKGTLLTPIWDQD